MAITYAQKVANINSVASTSAADKARAISYLTPDTPSGGSGSSSSVNTVKAPNDSSYKYNTQTGELNTNYKPTTTIDTKSQTETPPIFPTKLESKYTIQSILAGIPNGKTDLSTINQFEKDKSQETETNVTKMLQDLIGEKPSQEKLYQEALQQSGKEAAQKLFNEKQAQLNQIVTNAQALQQQVVGQGRGIPEAIIGGQQAQIAREAAISALPISAELSAAQGNLEMANENLNTWYKLKSEDAANNFAFKTKIADYAIQFATKEEEREINFVKDVYKEQQTKIQNNLAAIQSIALEVAKNGKSTAFLNNIDTSSPTAVMAAINMAGSGLVSPSQEIIKLDNGNVVIWDKNQNKIIKTIIGAESTDSTTGNASNFGSIISQTMLLEGTVNGQKELKNAMTKYLNNQDYVSAYQQIENSVESKLTGTTKTKFADSKIDATVLKGLREKIVEYKDAGGNMGLLKGKAEEIERKLLGVTGNPELTSLATALTREFQSYRVMMTGAAFSPEESRDYASVNPKTTSNFNLNLAVIDGAIMALDNRVNSTVDTYVSSASQIRDLANKTTSNVDAKTKMNNLYKTVSNSTVTIIDSLYAKNYDDESVLEYLTIKGLK